MNKDAVIERVRELTGVDLRAPKSGAEVTAAVAAMETLRASGLAASISEKP